MYDFQVFYIIKLCDECIIWIIIRIFGKLRKTDQSWRERKEGKEGRRVGESRVGRENGNKWKKNTP